MSALGTVLSADRRMENLINLHIYTMQVGIHIKLQNTRKYYFAYKSRPVSYNMAWGVLASLTPQHLIILLRYEILLCNCIFDSYRRVGSCLCRPRAG